MRRCLAIWALLLCAIVFGPSPRAQLSMSGVGGGFGPAASAGTTWDASNKSTHITLSGGNLVATSGAGSAFTTFVRSTPGRSTGKFYAEFTLTNKVGAGTTGVGLVDGTLVPDIDGMSVTSHSILYFDDGNVYQNGAPLTAALSTFTTADIIGMAVDVDAALFWIRKNGGSWNTGGLSNPATGVDGLTFTAVAPVYVGSRMDVSGTVWTANFGGSGYSQTAPSGYGNW